MLIINLVYMGKVQGSQHIIQMVYQLDTTLNL